MGSCGLRGPGCRCMKVLQRHTVTLTVLFLSATLCCVLKRNDYLLHCFKNVLMPFTLYLFLAMLCYLSVGILKTSLRPPRKGRYYTIFESGCEYQQLGAGRLWRLAAWGRSTGFHFVDCFRVVGGSGLHGPSCRNIGVLQRQTMLIAFLSTVPCCCLKK